ncbi:MAG: hypothetical protein PHH16_04260 [Candidatus Gracilibacteria bacterium]|nr:hypothetical protein [Candidatus Gracilibacteria bacterium]
MLATATETHHEDLIETKKEIGTFSMNETVECELTPVGMRYLEESERFEVLKFGIKGNRLQIQLWEFVNLFGGTFSMVGPQYIVDNNVVLLRDKTTEEIMNESRGRAQTTIEAKPGTYRRVER